MFNPYFTLLVNDKIILAPHNMKFSGGSRILNKIKRDYKAKTVVFYKDISQLQYILLKLKMLRIKVEAI